MMAYVGFKSALQNFDKFIDQMRPKSNKLVRKFERILKELYKQSVSLLFKQTCLKRTAA